MFEVIQIDEDNGAFFATLANRLQTFSEGHMQVMPVRQTGQRIVTSQVVCAFFSFLEAVNVNFTDEPGNTSRDGIV